LKEDPDQLEVREWEENVKRGEDLEEMRSGIYKGVLVETDIDEGLQGIQTNRRTILVPSVEGNAD
jgi:hypothetical protein